MPKQPRWHDHAEKHLSDAIADIHDPPGGTYLALVAIAAGTLAEAQELRRIRRLLERQYSNRTAAFNSTVTLVPKDGGIPMPATVVNPTESQNVLCTIDPKNAAGAPTTGPFTWSSSNPGQVTVQPAADGKSCLGVTNTGDIDVVLIVTDTVSNSTDSFPIQRTAPPPPDNATVAFNPSSTAVDK